MGLLVRARLLQTPQAGPLLALRLEAALAFSLYQSPLGIDAPLVMPMSVGACAHLARGDQVHDNLRQHALEPSIGAVSPPQNQTFRLRARPAYVETHEFGREAPQIGGGIVG